VLLLLPLLFSVAAAPSSADLARIFGCACICRFCCGYMQLLLLLCGCCCCFSSCSSSSPRGAPKLPLLPPLQLLLQLLPLLCLMLPLIMLLPE
jgi:hypothetical protein